MKREIEFRGLTKQGEWIFGDLNHINDKYYIFNRDGTNGDSTDRYEVVKESIGQYTEIKDSNGKKAYDGDKTIIMGEPCVIKFVTYFVHGWEFKLINKIGSFPFSRVCTRFDNMGCKDFEIIGTIHD